MQNRTFFVLLRPIFGEKLKTAPPKEIGFQSCEVHAVIRPEKALEYPILAEKSVSISVKTFFLEITCFWAEKTFEFPISAEKSVSISGKTFFWRSPVFGLKKRLNFRVFREIPSQFSDKPRDSDSRTMKIRVKVVCTLLTLSKKPPLFQILATRLAPIITYQTRISSYSVANWLLQLNFLGNNLRNSLKQITNLVHV